MKVGRGFIKNSKHYARCLFHEGSASTPLGYLPSKYLFSINDLSTDLNKHGTKLKPLPILISTSSGLQDGYDVFAPSIIKKAPPPGHPFDCIMINGGGFEWPAVFSHGFPPESAPLHHSSRVDRRYRRSALDSPPRGGVGGAAEAVGGLPESGSVTAA